MKVADPCSATPQLLQYDTIGQKSASLRQIHLDDIEIYAPNLYSKSRSQTALTRYLLHLFTKMIWAQSLGYADIVIAIVFGRFFRRHSKILALTRQYVYPRQYYL